MADARGVRAVTSGPLYRFLLGFECRKNVIGMVLDNEVSDRTSFLPSLGPGAPRVRQPLLRAPMQRELEGLFRPGKFPTTQEGFA